jgi:hypothetical protein
MARHRNNEQSLVTLAENCRQAANHAKAFCDAIATRSNGIASVRVEEWVGTLTEGEWRPVSPWLGGFSHRFPAQSIARNGRNGDQHAPSLPSAGDKVQCVLLGEKTRKGGWKAKLLNRGPDGPITNTADLPKTATPGQAVTLRVGSMSQDGKQVQFLWKLADNGGCGRAD